jgi:hypothetical protein
MSHEAVTLRNADHVRRVRPGDPSRRQEKASYIALAVKLGPSVRTREWERDPVKGVTRRIEAGVGLVNRRPTPARERGEQVILGTGKS